MSESSKPQIKYQMRAVFDSGEVDTPVVTDDLEAEAADIVEFGLLYPRSDGSVTFFPGSTLQIIRFTPLEVE